MAPGYPPAARADRLRVVRRADWRFLLARPHLGAVAYLGRHDSALVDALREVSDDIALDAATAEADRHDLVVAVAPTRTELALAPALLRPGGWIYVEAGGLLRRPRRAGALHGASACVRALRALGFDDAAAHWHFPDFASCLEIVPLDDARALELSLRRRQRTPATQMRVLAARLALGLGILPHVVPAASVVARLPQAAAGRP